MNQTKYLVKAVLLLFTLILVLLFFLSLPSLILVKDNPEVIDVSIPKDEKSDRALQNTQGFKLFQQNCATCHAINKIITGPALNGVLERGPWEHRANIYKWIHNPGAFIPTYPYTKELQKVYGQIMPSFPQLSEKDIDGIIDYIEYASGPVS